MEDWCVMSDARQLVVLSERLVLLIVNPNVAVSGLLSRIVVRKTGRRAAADGKQTVPVAVRVSDGEGGVVTDNGHVSTEADVAREQFPFIFNLLRGHAINTQALGQVSAAENRRSKTSQQHHHQQQQQQQPARKPTAAVATCRQRQATFTSRGTRVFFRHSYRQILELELH